MAKSNNLNYCLFEGCVTHLPEYYPEKGKLLCFSIAVNADHVSDKVAIDVSINKWMHLASRPRQLRNVSITDRKIDCDQLFKVL